MSVIYVRWLAVVKTWQEKGGVADEEVGAARPDLDDDAPAWGHKRRIKGEGIAVLSLSCSAFP